MKIYFIMSIDTECDKKEDWSVRYPFEYRNILEAIPERLQIILNANGVKPTYLLSPEILISEKCVNVLKNLNGDIEYGTHLHGEYVDPDKNLKSNYTNDFQADYDYSVELEKIKNLTTSFKNVFGYRPASFRAGRFGIGPNTFRILHELGYLVDSSIYPFSKIKTVKHDYNYYYYPVKPYYPDFSNMAVPGRNSNNDILHVPITIHNVFYQKLHSFFGKPLTKSELVQSSLRMMLGRDKVKTFSLRPSTNSYAKMKEISERHLAIHENDEPVFLNMMFHSNELIPQASPYNKTNEDVNDFLERIDCFLNLINSWGVTYIKLKDSYDIMMKISNK